MPYPGTSGGDFILTGPCEAAYPTSATSALEPMLLKCGEPGKLRRKGILPWGTMLCDVCHAKMEARALRKEQEKRGTAQ